MKKQKTIQTRQTLEWHFIYLYLEMLQSMGAIKKDAEFQKMYNQLMHYLNNKVLSAEHGDVVDTYVVIEQKPN